MKKVWLAAVLGYLVFSARVSTVPICAHGQAGCHSPSLAELFDRVLQQSSRMHGISSDLHSESGQYIFPNKNFVGQRRCHTHSIVTPDDKENAQQLGLLYQLKHFSHIQREQLTEVILRLLGAWSDPLSQLYWSMSLDQNQDFNHYSSNKALEITDMVQELRGGVAKIAEKMKLEGVLGNAVGYVSPENLVSSSFYRRGELNLMDHHDLLYCFRRDSNKVKNYLRILKCTTLPHLEC